MMEIFRRLWMSVIMLCCVITVSAQEVQKDRNRTYRITLGNVEYAHHNEKMSAGEAVGQVLSGVLTGKTSIEATKYEDDVKSSIIKGLSGAHRYRYNDGLLQIKDIVEEGNVVVNALITNINASSSSSTWKDKDGKTQVTTTYTGVVEVVLTMKDAKTGEIIDNTSLRSRGLGSSSFSTSDKAIHDAIDGLSNNVTAWLNKKAPLQANIIEGAAVKKDKQKEVYIDMGSSEGAYKGLHMGVYEVKSIGGREAKSQIGKLKIEEVEGDDISRCKVQSGGKDIKTALDAGQQLRVMSID
jgi:hypothetical protein